MAMRRRTRPISRRLQFDFLLGLDGISLSLIVLTTLLTVSCVLISWESISDRAAGFYAACCCSKRGWSACFHAFDLILFYVFFEFTLVPLFFLIGIWGGPQRRYAAVKFFLYTFVGSLVTLLGSSRWCWLLVGRPGDADFDSGARALVGRASAATSGCRLRCSWRSASGFMVKVPVFPLHTWLPLAHVEAPTAGSVLLAGVLLKLGTYGFLRLCLPLFPYACETVGVPLMAGAGGGRHHLRFALCARAARHQEAGGVQQRGASWVLHARACSR